MNISRCLVNVNKRIWKQERRKLKIWNQNIANNPCYVFVASKTERFGDNNHFNVCRN